MQKVQKDFLVRILLFSAITFGVHILILYTLNLPLLENKIVLAYAVNLATAILVFNVLYIFREKFKTQLGFLFVFGSVFKVILFFIFFNSPYRADGVVSGIEFAAFFVPYAITLIVEVYSLAKWMNKF